MGEAVVSLRRKGNALFTRGGSPPSRKDVAVGGAGRCGNDWALWEVRELVQNCGLKRQGMARGSPAGDVQRTCPPGDTDQQSPDGYLWRTESSRHLCWARETSTLLHRAEHLSSCHKVSSPKVVSFQHRELPRTLSLCVDTVLPCSHSPPSAHGAWLWDPTPEVTASRDPWHRHTGLFSVRVCSGLLFEL